MYKIYICFNIFLKQKTNKNLKVDIFYNKQKKKIEILIII